MDESPACMCLQARGRRARAYSAALHVMYHKQHATCALPDPITPHPHLRSKHRLQSPCHLHTRRGQATRKAGRQLQLITLCNSCHNNCTFSAALVAA
jgi:hypothetical protein